MDKEAWVDSLNNAQGEVGLNYIALLAHWLGGMPKLFERLRPESALTPSLSIFTSAEVSVGEDHIFKAIEAVRDKSTQQLAVAYTLVECIASIFAIETGSRHASVGISLMALVLDRVFVHAEQDTAGTAWRIDERFADRRRLASVSLSEMITRQTGRYITFQWSKFAELMDETIQNGGVRISWAPEFEKTLKPSDVTVAWSDVLEKMSPASREKAAEFFRQNSSVRKLVIVSARGARATAGRD